ncbi:MAG: glycine cleavage system protein H [Thermodesulfobacteriota bacterium]|jgi:glycine cleavage system H protein|nr:MAG: glycine cleavage system protein H [Thermodesulfobacteriota bacterium]
MEEFLEYTHEKFIFKVKTGYWYSPEDFWANIVNHVAVIGVSDFLQKLKGDVAFLETISPGITVKRGQELGKIETIKATFNIISPVTGTIVEVNQEIEASPYLINEAPYDSGWIYRIELLDFEADKNELLKDWDYFELMKKKVLEEARKLYGEKK